MGQSINVKSKQIDGFCVFTTDRTITGQDGARFTSHAEAEEATGFPALLAASLFASDESVANVYIASNDVIVGRGSDWDPASTSAAAKVITDLYRFYQ